VHVSTRFIRNATSRGLRDRTRLWSGDRSQPGTAPSSCATTRVATPTGVVSVRSSRRRVTVVPRPVCCAGGSVAAVDSITSRPSGEYHSPWLIKLVKWYQRGVEGRPSPCRFTPSCSAYAIEALQVHGSRRGLWLTVRRLARCRPFGPSGPDLVPPPRTGRLARSRRGPSSDAPVTTGPDSGPHSRPNRRKVSPA
jgi:uncharacterized protein